MSLHLMEHVKVNMETGAFRDITFIFFLYYLFVDLKKPKKLKLIDLVSFTEIMLFFTVLS